MKRFLIITLGLILAFLVGAAAPTVVAVGMYQEMLAIPDPEGEYYRAIYDVCAAQTGDRGMCLEAAAGLRKKGWHERFSPGYEWPLAQPEATY